MKDALKRIILENQERMPFSLFSRRIETLRTTCQIHAVIGLRRAGKTFFLYQIVNELLGSGVPKEAVLLVNFEDERLAALSAERLGVILDAYYELFPERTRGEVHVFLDEVQVVPGWERFVARLFENKRYRLTITGSSSKLLSMEIATSLRGRSVSTHIYPLSFSEFASYRGLEVDQRTAFRSERYKAVKLLDSYLAWGGFFEVQDAHDDGERRRIVSTYVDLVVYRDLVERYSVKNLTAMKALIRYFVTNTTRKASLSKLGATLGAGPVSRNTIAQYTSFLEDTNVLYACTKFSYKLSQGNTPSKFYLADPSFKTVAGANFSADRGLFFENAVYMELRRRGLEVSFFEDKGECDFITKSGTKVIAAYQVCVDPARAGEREEKGLLAALDTFNMADGTIITADEDREESSGGKRIRYIPLWRWLLESEVS
jgi:uncharacterized protein